jgi:hypothetical protein
MRVLRRLRVPLALEVARFAGARRAVPDLAPDCPALEELVRDAVARRSRRSAPPRLSP